MSANVSPIHSLLGQIVDLGARGHDVIDAFLDSLPVHEQAALAYAWEGLWARPSQVPPIGTWRSFGTCGGRGWGKTMTIVGHLISEVEAGRAMRIALLGQSEAKTVEILVEGASGILALTPPWLGAAWEPSSNRVVFGNGAEARVYTAAEPSGLRGPQHHIGLATELSAWPASTRDEAMSNLLLGLRLGYGRLLWDATPRRRNPLIKERFALAAKDPTKHIVIRGATRENEMNLTPGFVSSLEDLYAGTARGAEELEGTFLDDDAGALFKSSWFEKTRRKKPDALKRRIISIDPSITDNAKRSDATGIIDAGLGLDGQVFICGNKSGKWPATTWPGMVIDIYIAGGCDLILCELNRGGTAWAALLRVAARERGLTFTELGPDEVPGYRPGVVFFRGYTSRNSKTERAAGAAAMCERGRVSLVVDADLGTLEDRLCGFTGEENKPDDEVDAFSAAVHELAGLAVSKPDPRAAFKGILELRDAAQATGRSRHHTSRPSIAADIQRLIGHSNRGGRI